MRIGERNLAEHAERDSGRRSPRENDSADDTDDCAKDRDRFEDSHHRQQRTAQALEFVDTTRRLTHGTVSAPIGSSEVVHMSAVTARVHEHRAVDEEHDEQRNRHANEGFHAVEGRAVDRGFAESRPRS